MRRRSLRSPTTRALVGAVQGLLALLGLPGCDRGAAPPPGAPSVILVSIDTLRADRLGAYGYERPTTPALDQLAAGGVLFERAVAPAPWTMPSHASLLTGLLPARHGMLDVDRRLPDTTPTLAETIARAGFRTAAFVNSPYLVPKSGLVRGFEHYRYFDIADPDSGRQVLSAEPAIAEICAWLDAHGNEPFFLFFHTFDVHSDYQPGPRYREQFVRPYQGSFDGRSITLNRVRSGEIVPTAADVAHVSDLYDGAIRQLDDRLSKLFDHLRETGLAPHTYVMVTSDHGEEFFEHGSVLHGRTLFEEVLHVPLLVRGPGVPAGLRIPALVALVDVPLTILGLLGIPAETPGDGIDLRPLWQNGGTAAPVRAEAFAEAAPWKLWRGAQGHLIGVRTERFKLIRDLRSNRTLLYDLVTDPDETHNLSVERPEQVAALAQQLERYLAPVRREAPIGDLSAEEIERLRALGYAN